MGDFSGLPPVPIEQAGNSLYALRQENIQNAYHLEEQIVARVHTIRRQWVELAGLLYQFHGVNGYERLGYSTLNEWLASPDIELSRSLFFQLVETWRELVVERGVSPAELDKLDISKVQKVLPAIRRGHATANEALADAEVLTVTDLKDKYDPAVLPADGRPGDKMIEPDTFHYERCKTCGTRLKVMDKP